MSKKEIRLQRRVCVLEGALQPFSRFSHESPASKVARGVAPDPDDVFVPTEGAVWFYVGAPLEGCRMHLHTDDFQLARSLVR